jgi:uncharacterized protein
MKITLVGATGFVGGFILTEALNRGHMVKGVTRHPEKLPIHKNLTGINADIYNEAEVGSSVAGSDAVISSFNPGWGNPDIYDLFVKGCKSIINGVKESGIKRFLMIGGAGSLFVKPGIQLVDTPDFPAEYKNGALGARDVLNLLKNETGLDWTVLCPSINLKPDRRTNKFRIGTDSILFNENGESAVSTQDLAIAVLDELENPKFIRKRFTVGY